MKKVYHLPDPTYKAKQYSSGVSYIKDIEDLVCRLIGSVRPMVDDSAVIIGDIEYHKIPDSYRNKSEFLRHSF